MGALEATARGKAQRRLLSFCLGLEQGHNTGRLFLPCFRRAVQLFKPARRQLTAPTTACDCLAPATSAATLHGA
eukprot:6852517-Alexandrium_andersonii.AAC.1